MALIEQEVSAEPWIQIPDEVRDIYTQVETDPDVPRAWAREGARYARAHLLQVRGREPGRVAQAQHRGAAGLLQQARGREADHHRDGRRSVGERAQLRVPDLRRWVRGVHGPHQLRSEAVSQADDEYLGRRGRFLRPATQDRGRVGRFLSDDPESPGSLGIAISEAVERAATDRANEVLARKRSQSRPHPPDDHRARGDQADGEGRVSFPTS